MAAPLLTIRNLNVEFPSRVGVVKAVRGLNLTVGHEKVGIVGESGSGKSITARAILRLIPPPGRVRADELSFDGTDILRASNRQMRSLRGQRISMVMQDPKFSLNPVITVGKQIAEAEKTEAGGGEDDAGHVQRQPDDYRRQAERDDVVRHRQDC